LIGAHRANGHYTGLSDEALHDDGITPL
jgi:hypothetical protein